MDRKGFSLSIILLMLLAMCSCSLQQSSSVTTYQEEHVATKESTIPTTTSVISVIIETDSPDVMYEKALNYFSDGEYTSALPLFEYLGDYEKSADYLIACNFILQLSGFYTYRTSNELFIFEIGKNVRHSRLLKTGIPGSAESARPSAGNRHTSSSSGMPPT